MVATEACRHTPTSFRDAQIQILAAYVTSLGENPLGVDSVGAVTADPSLPGMTGRTVAGTVT